MALFFSFLVSGLLPTALAGFFYATGYPGLSFPFFHQTTTLPLTTTATTTATSLPALPAPFSASLLGYTPSFLPAFYYPYSSGCRNVLGAAVPCALPYNVAAAAATTVTEAAPVAPAAEPATTPETTEAPAATR